MHNVHTRPATVTNKHQLHHHYSIRPALGLQGYCQLTQAGHDKGLKSNGNRISTFSKVQDTTLYGKPRKVLDPTECSVKLASCNQTIHV